MLLRQSLLDLVARVLVPIQWHDLLATLPGALSPSSVRLLPLDHRSVQ